MQIKQFTKENITITANGTAQFDIPIENEAGWFTVGIIRAWITNRYVITHNAYLSSTTNVNMSASNISNTNITVQAFVTVLYFKK